MESHYAFLSINEPKHRIKVDKLKNVFRLGFFTR